MKSIDIKSLIIGVLLASTVFFGMAASHNISGLIGGPIEVEVTLKNGGGHLNNKFEFK